MSRLLTLRPLTSILLLAGVLVLAGCGGNSPTQAPPTGTPIPTVQGTLVSRPSEQLGDSSGAIIGRIACDAGSHQGGVVAKATLTITVDKTSFRPSSNLGVLKSCTYWLHTDASGTLVFDAPAGSAPATLMEFFSVIRNTNGTDPYIDQFAQYVTSGTITVNGKAPTDPNWGNIVIHDGDQIVVTAKAATPAPISQPSATAPASTPTSSPSA